MTLKRLKCLTLLAFGVLAGCTQQYGAVTQTAPGAPPLVPVSMAQLPGWQSDDTAAALTAFVRGCKTILVMPADQSLGGIGYSQQMAGQAGQWQNACTAGEGVAPGDANAARNFFQSYFSAYRIDVSALITGYFEPEYPGAKNPMPGYTVPLYAKPAAPDLATLSRAQIDAGALYRKTPVTAYLADPVDVFMLQIQGSGRITLPNGTMLRVGYDGDNGQLYTPIGRIMVQQGDLSADNVSFQSISAWLKANPTQARVIMEQNTRYVYLKPVGGLSEDEGAPGSLGVPVSAGRTLAVDPKAIPLGVPVFLTTTDPVTGAALDRLTIAQDTGGGIHGASAADLFFGAGPSAEATAGRMRQQGTLYLLLPRPAASS